MKQLISSIEVPGAPVMVIFGGNPVRRHEVLSMLSDLGGISAHGALSEEEGVQMLRQHPEVQLVLIGGRYSELQRQRIRDLVRTTYPRASITEPGWQYPYDNDAIIADIRSKLGS
jgi:hypothetical protein